jgi:hypothetical protein
MNLNYPRRGFRPALAFLAFTLSVSTWAQTVSHRFQAAMGPRFQASSHPVVTPHRSLPAHGADARARLRYWNEVAINASGLDHTPPAPGENRVFGEQLGPGRASRAMAIVHLAMFEAVNAVAGGYQSYVGLPPASPATSADAAIAQAARDTLAAMFPSQAPSFDQLLAQDLAQLPPGRPTTAGRELGREAGAAILALRATDGAAHPEPRLGIDFFPSDQPGKWRQDPISQIPLALGAHWGEVMPFVMKSPSQFRVPPPPATA